MAKDLLWEIGTEEIPARFMSAALQQLRQLAAEGLQEARLPYEKIAVYGTPRRLALLVTNLAEKQDDLSQEVRGPAQKAAFDENNRPTKALLGFCRGHGIEPQKVIVKDVNGVAYCFAQKNSQGEDAHAILPPLLMQWTQKLYFPKPMRWAFEEMRFARPLRWLVALFGEDVLPVELGGVKAGRTSRTHRFLGAGEVTIQNAASYVQTLKENYVMVDQDLRKEIIWRQIQEKAASYAGVVQEDRELLEEITYLVEYPTALTGKVDTKYLALPPELIITPMREHQRYFPVYDQTGGLLPLFVTVRNGLAEHADIVAAGNEKVLRARLADAQFFWQEDLKKTLPANVEKLKHIVYHEKLGTMYAKVARIQKLAAYLAKEVQSDSPQELALLDRAAFLAKADLASNAVCEFTELQGIMGYYYALYAGEDKTVALAIRDHYRPRFAGDALPVNRIGQLVAVSDKLDSLCGLFAVGLTPTGSQDPYALRRQAMGVSQIILANRFSLSIAEMVSFSYDLLAPDAALKLSKEELRQTVSGFFGQRLEAILSDQGMAYDTVKAVMAFGVDNLWELSQKAQALQSFRQKEGPGQLLTAFNRAANLAKNAQQIAVDPLLFTDHAEQVLYASLQEAEKAAAAAAALGEYEKILDAVGALKDDIDSFFTAVLVMDKDERIKNNRLALLKRIALLGYQVGDLSLLVV